MYSEVMKFSEVKFLGCFSEADLSNGSKIRESLLQFQKIKISRIWISYKLLGSANHINFSEES